MKKQNLLLELIFILVLVSAYGQETNTKFGLKGGVNYAKYTPDVVILGITAADYKRKFGFYIGGFANFDIEENFKIQPELLFGLQGTSISSGDIEIRQSPNDVPIVSEEKRNIIETTIIVPVVGQYYLSKKFYLEGGPQFGFIIKRDEKVVKTPFNNEPFGGVSGLDNDTFDFGLAVGAGYKLNDKFILSTRYFFGLIERDNAYKSSVLNLGIEYQL